MKKRKLIATMIILGSLSLASCSYIQMPSNKPNEETPETQTYTITFINDDATNTITINENNKISKPNDPIKEGYSFIGWYLNDTLFDFNTLITSNITLTAKYQKNTSPVTSYSVTFVNDNGEDNNVISINENNKISKPNDPIKEGYSFIGWYLNDTLFDFNTLITSNITLTAKYQKIENITVSFVVNGVATNQIVKYNEKISKPNDPTKDNALFAGWYTENNEIFDFNTNVKTNITLTAKFKYTITYKNDNSIYKTESILENNKLTKPNDPIKDGYSFIGWYVEGNDVLFDFNEQINESYTLYAKWEKTNIKITAYSGYTEGAYFEITDSSNSNYSFSYKKSDSSTYVNVDKELIRKTNNVVRCDILGLSEGQYTVKISNGNEEIEKEITVTSDDRSGYAHFNYTDGIGAYNDNGTLKSNAIVIYVNEENKNTVKATINQKEYTGLGSILANASSSKVPLDIRIVGRIAAATWNSLTVNAYSAATATTVKGTNDKYLELKNYNEDDIINAGFNTLNETTYSKLNGLTNKIKYDNSKKEFDSYYNMMDISNAKNITIEGVGTDAEVFQWGFTWKSCNSIEVKNITFTDSPEDACSFEGSKLTASTTDTSKNLNEFKSANLWLHNNTFNLGKNYWDVCSEQDKHEGDGSTDLKYVKNITISYNKFIKTHKTGLVGGSDDQLTANVTFHHNFYDGCQSRMPFARQANMHMYNNYYKNSTGTTMQIYAGAYAFIENCYFEGDKHAFSIDNRNFGVAAIKSYNNIFDNSKYVTGITTVTDREAKVKNGNLFNQNFDTDSSFFYYDSKNKKSNVLNMLDSENVKTYIPLHAGAGMLTSLYETTTPTTPTEEKYIVSFDTAGGSSITSQNVIKGSSITLPTPTKAGYKFVGWYTTSSLTTKVDNTYTPTSNITLYAKWENDNTSSSFKTMTLAFNTTNETKTESFTAGDFKVLATSNKDVLYNEEYIGLKGGGTTTYRAIVCETNTAIELKLSIIVSGGKDDRFLIIADENGNEINKITVTANNTIESTITISGHNKYYLYSGGSGLNIYSLTISI